MSSIAGLGFTMGLRPPMYRMASLVAAFTRDEDDDDMILRSNERTFLPSRVYSGETRGGASSALKSSSSHGVVARWLHSFLSLAAAGNLCSRPSEGIKVDFRGRENQFALPRACAFQSLRYYFDVRTSVRVPHLSNSECARLMTYVTEGATSHQIEIELLSHQRALESSTQAKSIRLKGVRVVHFDPNHPGGSAQFQVHKPELN
ncbi:Hypothetical predicted protein [Olea europaea subsp. europaea]|uniref:Uncharacterized protein n=1 Tax=Olea europaea subsp. europaea TaxID=158383 RepID=A0A8S0TMA1_OLEEU|nr:Hypothetical predicted protein [Olea europaea subsp. europaea]